MSTETSIVINENGRLRSGWRAAIFLFTFFVFSFVFIFATLPLVALLIGSSAGFLPIIVPFAVSTIVAIVFGWLFGKIFEDLPFRALGISFSKGCFRNLCVGLLVGAGTLAAAVVIVVIFGGMTVHFNSASSTTAIIGTLETTLLIFAVGALSEETLFRGYLLQTFARARILRVGVGFTSVLFAAAHFNNPDFNWISVINTLLAGAWFAFAYLKTRDLWFPVGMHLMWNWMQGPIFGINVSGIAEFSPDPVLKTAEFGPVWLTGGNYGIEGGIGCTAAIILSIALVYFLPGLKPSDEMLNLTDRELPKTIP